MTPNDFYALPSTSTDPWFDSHCIVGEIMEIDGWHDLEDEIKAIDQGRFVVHEKLHFDEDGERGVSVYALEFDNAPFAILFPGGRGGRDSRDAFVTDPKAWQAARDHAVTLINRQIKPSRVVDAGTELGTGYYNAKIAKFGEEVRLVAVDDVHPLTGNPVYDRKKFDAHFDKFVRPLGAKIGIERGMDDPRLMEAGFAAFRAGVLGETIDLDIDLGSGTRIVSASVVDGQTFVYQVRTAGKGYGWARSMDPHMVGPASMIYCFADIAAGRALDPRGAYVLEAAEAFGADPDDIHRELVDFVANGGRCMAERIVAMLPDDPRVPASLTVGRESFTIAHMVLANPSLIGFCADGYPDLQQAKELVAKAAELDARIAASEIKSPRPS
jgi:hypothetical protein